MNLTKPFNQEKLLGLDDYFLDLVRLYKKNVFPSKILFSGQKGIGKSTLAYHFINFVLSEYENEKYDIENFKINTKSSTFKTIVNKSNINLIALDVNYDKKSIDINQIRNLIVNLNKSSFNEKPRFVLIDNIELLNTNSINALLKFLEEPNENIYFILINNNVKILPTLLSRCINYKIKLSNQEIINITNQLLNGKLNTLVNLNFISYYFTPGNLYQLVNFAELNNYDLLNLNLKDFLKIIIKENHYKKNDYMKYIFFQMMEIYFLKMSQSFSINAYNKYTYFIKRISDTKIFNLDEESLFIEFERDVLNG